MTPTSVEDLRCAVWTARQAPDPVGSAPRFDSLVVVEVPAPWPEDVADAPILAAATSAPPDHRVMAVLPDPTRAPGRCLVTTYRRDGLRCSFVGTDSEVGVGDLDATLRAITSGDDVPGTAAPPEFLVCSHGARDRCCGSLGTRLHVEVAARHPEVRVRRTSHLGGHRFAPTALSLPDGRLWAHLDVDVVAGVLRAGDPGRLVRHYRGTPTLGPRHQVVEREAFVRAGRDALRWPVVDTGDDGERVTVTFATGDGELRRWSAVVDVVRELPVLDCGHPPEEARKTSPEYAARDVRVDVVS